MRLVHRLCLVTVVLFSLGLGSGARAEPRYTDHPPQGGRSETIQIYVDPRFSPRDSDDIASAIGEWNRVLNGVVKFDAGPLPSLPERKPRAWVITRGAGKEGVSEYGRGERSLGTVQPMPMGGGVLLIFDRALKPANEEPIALRDVMMRELGHLAGLRHTTDTELLARDYGRGDASCVTHATASAIAALRNVPVTALNWCRPY